MNKRVGGGIFVFLLDALAERVTGVVLDLFPVCFHYELRGKVVMAAFLWVGLEFFAVHAALFLFWAKGVQANYIDFR